MPMVVWTAQRLTTQDMHYICSKTHSCQVDIHIWSLETLISRIMNCKPQKASVAWYPNRSLHHPALQMAHRPQPQCRWQNSISSANFENV